MHNAALRALGLDAVYVALPTPAEALPPVLAALAVVGGWGTVTGPHKEAAERCMARKTDLCARVGACNTFWTERGELVGDNTDVPGVLACLRQLDVDGARRWVLIGTGGAARAVAVAAAELEAEVHVLSRDAARAQRFADWAKSRGARVQPARGALEPEVAINATPLGLKETDPLPLDPARTERLSAALDLVYCRGGTRWVRALRAGGIPAHDGREMLVQQGVAAFARFFPGHPAPVEVMRAAVAGIGLPEGDAAWLVPVPLGRQRLRERGYNQSERLARALARRWRRPVVDLLTRVRETATQTALTPEARLANVAGAFHVRNGECGVRSERAPANSALRIPHSPLVLVDDVFTTGATLAEAARALEQAGARTVLGVTFGRAILPDFT